MVRAKKIPDNPVPTFRNGLIRKSEANTWDKAKREWDVVSVYYVSKGTYRTCLCSPSAVSNLTVIINRRNSNQLEICNQCAKIYLNKTENSKIEDVLYRLRANEKSTISQEILDRMLEEQVISFDEFQCYNTLKRKRDDSLINQFKKEINRKLINYTDYKNKRAFDDINSILVWVRNVNSKFDLTPVVRIWNDILGAGMVDIDALDSIIADNDINRCFYPKKEIEAARGLLEKYMDAKNVNSHVYKAYLHTIPEEITDFGVKRDIPTREEYANLKNLNKHKHNVIQNREVILDEYGLEYSSEDDYNDDDDEYDNPYLVDDDIDKKDDYDYDDIDKKDNHDYEKHLQETKRNRIIKNIIQNTFTKVGLLIIDFMKTTVHGNKIIDFNYSIMEPYLIVRFFDVPELNRLYERCKHERIWNFDRMIGLCDDNQLECILSAVIEKTEYQFKEYVIEMINETLYHANRALIRDDADEEGYKYKIVTPEMLP